MNPWTKEQDAFLRANFRRYTVYRLASLVGHPWQSVKARLRHLGVSRLEGIIMMVRPERDSAYMRDHWEALRRSS